VKIKGSSRKISYVLAWINWLLSAFCVIFFILILAFAFIKVDANWRDKIYALLVLFSITIFPAIFFFLNGLVLKSKNNIEEDGTESL